METISLRLVGEIMTKWSECSPLVGWKIHHHPVEVCPTNFLHVYVLCQYFFQEIPKMMQHYRSNLYI